MDDVPTFFFSHARQDTELPGNYLTSFFRDLERRLAQWSGVSLDDKKRIGTIDIRVTQGKDWDAALSTALVTDTAFVAILTPLYFNRPNCGKELAVFLLRHPRLNLNDDGSLSGVTNMLPIRWLPELAYASNAGKDARIPALLRKIEDTPADDLADSDRTLAIQRYRKKGMERCVNVEPHYTELLDLIVATLRDMQALPPSTPTTFDAAKDAFKYDWRAHFGPAQGEASASVPAAIQLAPQPLSDVVATYVTNLPFTEESQSVAFADILIAESLPGAAAPTEPFLQSLIADVGKAGSDEGFHVFHAAAKQNAPAPAQALIDRLVPLTRRNVITALVVDADIWPLDQTSWFQQVVTAPDWVGPVLISGPQAHLVNQDAIAGTPGVQRRIVVLPTDSGERVTVIRRALVLTRGDLVRADTTNAASDALPVLKGVSPKSA